MEEVPNFLLLTKIRLSSLSTVKSLYRFGLETIIGSINPNATLTEQNGLERRVSPELREKILQELLREKTGSRKRCITEIKKLANVIPFFLNSRTKNLNLHPLLVLLPSRESSVFPYPRESDFSYMNKVLSKAAQLAPNLEHLVYTKRPKLQVLNDSTARLVSSFKMLKIVEMQGLSVNLAHLVDLCGDLPYLRVLNIGLVKYRTLPYSRKEISTYLGNLSLLCIKNFKRSQRAKQFIQDHVPNLDIITDLKHSVLSFDDFLLPTVEGLKQSQRKTFTCDSSWFEFLEANIHHKYPNVVHLQINGDDFLEALDARNSESDSESDSVDPEPEYLLPNFTNIASIAIKFNEYETTESAMEFAVDKVLIHYGHNLRSFFFDEMNCCTYETEEYNAQHIFARCPMLEKLALRVNQISTNTEKTGQILHLQELYLRSSRPMMNVLLVPQLRKVELDNIFLRDLSKDLRRTASLIAEEKILLELEIFHVDVHNQFDGVEFINLAEFIKTASAYLPKLTDLKLTFGGYEYVALARRMQQSDGYKKNWIARKVTGDVDVLNVFVDQQLIDTLAFYQN